MSKPVSFTTSCVKFSASKTNQRGNPYAMRKRSKYRPKGVRMDTLAYVISGLKPVLSHSEATAMRIRNHAAMTALTRGDAKRSDVDILIGAFNVTEGLVLINPDLGADWMAEIRAGQDALYNVAMRGATTHKFVLTGAEMAAMNLVLEIHEAQLEKATVVEMERATDVVQHRVRTKQARRITAK